MHNSNSTLSALLCWLSRSLLAVQRRHVTGSAGRLREPLLYRPSRTGSFAHRFGAVNVLSSSFARRRLVSPSNWNWNNQPAAKQRGLTLVELLVAISVLGIVAVLGWRGLDSIVRARVALNSDLEQTRGMQLAFAQLQSDCDHLYNFTASPARVPIVARQNSLTLIRTVYADNQPSRLQVISYRVKDGVLTRRESMPTRDLRELDTLWSSAVNDTDTGQDVVLQSDVSAMALRLWFSDGNGWRADTGQLLTAAGSSAILPVASGLEVTMHLQGRDNSLLKIFLLGAV